MSPRQGQMIVLPHLRNHQLRVTESARSLPLDRRVHPETIWNHDCMRCRDMLQMTCHEANFRCCTMPEETGLEQKALVLPFEMVEQSDVLRWVQIQCFHLWCLHVCSLMSRGMLYQMLCHWKESLWMRLHGTLGSNYSHTQNKLHNHWWKPECLPILWWNLGSVVLPFLQRNDPGITFQQDNAPIHIACDSIFFLKAMASWFCCG